MNKQHIEEDICQLTFDNFLLVNTFIQTYKIKVVTCKIIKHKWYSEHIQGIFIKYNNFIDTPEEFVNKIYNEGVINIIKEL